MMDVNMSESEADSDEEIGVKEINAFVIPSHKHYQTPFVSYSAKLKIAKMAKNHPSLVVESSCLDAIKYPDVSYKPKSFVLNGSLSSLQVEALLLSCWRHEKFHDHKREGILIGDGTGIGKGRQIAAIITENYIRGRKKSVWISTSSGLINDTERDFTSLKTATPKLLDFKLMFSQHRDSNIPFDNFCLFITYSAFQRQTSEKVEAILRWLGHDFDGVIALDECHTIKNFTSLASTAITKLDSFLPHARFIYSSATVVESSDELEYMNRLFLWGPGTSYPTFGHLKGVITKLGYLGMECIAMELKHRGSYVSRRLNFSGSTFSVKQVDLDTKQIALYNECVDIWSRLLSALKSAKFPGKRNFMRSFWKEQQQFFKMLCVSIKIKFVANFTRKCLKDGNAVVIGLQGTGDCVSQKFKGKTLPRIPSSLKVKLMSITRASLSVLNLHDEKILNDAKKVKLPSNSLDYLIQNLGGAKNVAELTGRVGRFERSGNRYKWQNIPYSKTKRLAEFTNGKKNVAIISEACSTGISLHADRSSGNKRKRIHITIELPWSANQVIQQCGRTLRSNQISSPDFVYVVSNCAGEKRFGYGISERMRALGAITQGDRNMQATGIQTYNLNSRYASDAVSYTLQSIGCMIDPVVRMSSKDELYNFFQKAFKPLLQAGFFKISKGKPNLVSNQQSVIRFINRLLGIQLPLQNEIFQYFTNVYDEIVMHSKKMGTYVEGMLDISRGNTYLSDKESYKFRGSNISVYTIMVDFGSDFSEVNRLAIETPGSLYFCSLSQKQSVYLAVPNPSNGLYSFIFPHGLLHEKLVDPRRDGYQNLPSSQVKKLWDLAYNRKGCYHEAGGPSCNNNDGTNYCATGNRFRRHRILVGVMWSNLSAIHNLLEESDIQKFQLVRCQLNNSNKSSDVNVVGILIPEHKYSKFSDNLFVGLDM